MLGLDITPLQPGVHTFGLEPSPEDLDLDPETFEALRVTIRLDLSEAQALVHLTAQATVTLECDRTLKHFTQPISGSHAVLFTEAHLVTESDAEQDVLPLPDPGSPLDLTRPTRDTLLLALPVRRVAPGADEQDLPLVFGAVTDEDGNPVDPRWEALRALRESPRDDRSEPS